MPRVRRPTIADFRWSGVTPTHRNSCEHDCDQGTYEIEDRKGYEDKAEEKKRMTQGKGDLRDQGSGVAH